MSHLPLVSIELINKLSSQPIDLDSLINDLKDNNPYLLLYLTRHARYLENSINKGNITVDDVLKYGLGLYLALSEAAKEKG